MTWDGIKRRTEENGGENPEVILARIDERIKTLIASGINLEKVFGDAKIEFSKKLEEHKIEDNEKFKEVNQKQERTNTVVLMASGGVVVIVFFINLFLRK